ncbi:SRPBCC domain-containing protein [Maricaulis sp.]|uniref:SRPBCC domain-containing protein n=1 Tax=Maricaulis sp. TaxID=1486257 RepID=UPI003A914FA1
MKRQTIMIDALVATPIDKAWQCWTQPDHITQWNFASDEWCCPNAANDLTIGGHYRARMEARDGSFGFDLEAVYNEVTEPSALGMVLTDGRSVRTVFVPEGKATRITTTFDAEAENSIDIQRDGWQAILNNFKIYVEANSDIGEPARL